MSRLFNSTPVDPRILSMTPDRIIGQTAAQRFQMHGPIQPMDDPRPRTRATTAFALAACALALASFGQAFLRAAL